MTSTSSTGSVTETTRPSKKQKTAKDTAAESNKMERKRLLIDKSVNSRVVTTLANPIHSIQSSGKAIGRSVAFNCDFGLLVECLNAEAYGGDVPEAAYVSKDAEELCAKVCIVMQPFFSW